MRSYRGAIWSVLVVALAAASVVVAFISQPRSVVIDVGDPRTVQGAQGRDGEGVWFGGDAVIASDQIGRAHV